MNNKILVYAIRKALIMVAAVTIALPMSHAMAQGKAVEEPDKADDTKAIATVEVTGSRIRQVDLETEQPVLVIGRKEIESQGLRTVADLLQNISAAGPPALSRSTPLAAGEAAGGSFVNLRNLGPARSLVLINGNRLGITTAGLSDLSSIPASSVDRIEILKDGASSIYGSDAIAGVINIITRKNYTGAQINVGYGQYGQGDGSRTNGDFVMGLSGDLGSLTMAAEYVNENEVFAKDRPFSAYPRGEFHPFLGWTTVSQWGSITGLRAPGDTVNRNYVLNRGANPLLFSNYHVLNPAAPNGDVSNTNEQMHLFNPLSRKSFFLDGTLEISENLRLRNTVLYSNRVSDRQVAGYPFQSAVFATPMAVNSYYNPLGVWHGFAAPQAINFSRRTWEIPRNAESDLDTLRLSSVLQGSFNFGERYFDWDAGFLRNSNKQVQTINGNLNIANVRTAVGPSFLNAAGIVQCGTPAAPIPLGFDPSECTPWNPLQAFGSAGVGGLSGNPDLTKYLFPEEHFTSDTKTTSAFVNVSGPILTLPAGDLAFAVGYEFRKEEGEFRPDALSQFGGTTNLVAAPTEGKYSVNELFLELNVPILSQVFAAKELTMNVSSRYSDYDTFGETTNSKIGLRWKPTEDVLVRGTWSEGFRAPTINDLVGGGSQTFPFFSDPCDTQFGASATNAAVRSRCAAVIANANTYRQLGQGFVPITVANSQTPLAFFGGGGNLNTLPETSKSKTLGIVWSPNFISGLGMTLDWWSIRIESTIVADNPTQLLNDCYIDNIASRCASFTRDPTNGIVNNLTFGGRNAGFTETQGYDFDVKYRFKNTLGDFDINWQTTYVSKGVSRSVDDPSIVPTPFVGFGGQFRVRSNMMLNWSKNSFSATWGMRYFSSSREACLNAVLFPDECNDPGFTSPAPGLTGPSNVTGSNTFHDMQVRWNAPWNATVSVGANNIFDHYGPQAYSQPNANFAYFGGFDIGRFFYMKYQQRF